VPLRDWLLLLPKSRYLLLLLLLLKSRCLLVWYDRDRRRQYQWSWQRFPQMWLQNTRQRIC
jgi:hypothetical protein